MGNVLFQFKRVMTALRTGWSILGITLVVLLLVEGIFRVSFALRDRASAVFAARPARTRGRLRRHSWPIEHFREIERLVERWEPYVYFRPRAFQGKTVTVSEEGLRATWQPPTERGRQGARAATKLLLLGGSSLWGFGARDDQTIPSQLARALHERGFAVEIKNLSALGYVSTQELVALVRELQAGYRPEVVLFYDGVNDTTSALLEGEAGLTTNEVNRRSEFNLLQSPGRLASALATKVVMDSASYRFARAVRRRITGADEPSRTAHLSEPIAALAEQVVRRYEANVALAASLGREFGFRPLFFWQPTVFTKPSRVPVEQEEAKRYAWSEPMFRAVYGGMRASTTLKATPVFHDVSTIFADAKELIFIDYCHTTETANATIAAVMADSIIKAVNPSDSEAAKQR